jgi:hypothetical protein
MRYRGVNGYSSSTGIYGEFFRDYLAVSKLRLNSASSVSPCGELL